MPIRTLVAVILLSLATANAAAQDYKAGLTGAAAGAVQRYIESARVACERPAKGERDCLLKSFPLSTKILYGRMPGDTDHAVAFMTYEGDSGGNAVSEMAVVFRADAAGTYVPIGRADNVVGADPREPRFERGAMTYTGTIVGPNDARCCPTGKARFKLLIAADGVTFVDPRDNAKGAAASAPAARSKAAAYLIRQEIEAACDGKPGKIDPAAAIERDLTGDGKADLIISHEGITCQGRGRSLNCGMQVCSVNVYVRDGALLKPVVDDLLAMQVKVGDGAIPSIHMLAHGGRPHVMKWNGRTFR